MRIALLILALGLVGCSAPAAKPVVAPADQARIKGVLQASGLIGTWGPNCAGPRETPLWERIRIDDSGAARTILGAGQYEKSYAIIDAKRISAGEVEATVVDEADGLQLTTVYRIDGDRQMTWSAVTSGGDALMTNGVSGSGRHAEWYNRCPNGIPAS